MLHSERHCGVSYELKEEVCCIVNTVETLTDNALAQRKNKIWATNACATQCMLPDTTQHCRPLYLLLWLRAVLLFVTILRKWNLSSFVAATGEERLRHSYHDVPAAREFMFQTHLAHSTKS